MMTQAITVRDSADTDISPITGIYTRSVLEETASFEFEPPDEAELARRRRAIRDAGFPYLVAEIDGKVAGYAYATAFRTRPGYAPTVENTVYVDPDVQRGGVGRALMKKLIDKCEALGYRQMIAVIGGSEHIASIEFHKSLGFEDAGTLKSVGYKHGKWLDTVYLQLALGPGDTTPPDRMPER